MQYDIKHVYNDSTDAHTTLKGFELKVYESICKCEECVCVKKYKPIKLVFNLNK